MSKGKKQHKRAKWPPLNPVDETVNDSIARSFGHFNPNEMDFDGSENEGLGDEDIDGIEVGPGSIMGDDGVWRDAVSHHAWKAMQRAKPAPGTEDLVKKDPPSLVDTTGKTWTELSCRHEPTGVFTFDGVSYYGGSDSKVYPSRFDGLVVNLLGQSAPDVMRAARLHYGSESWAARLEPFMRKEMDNYISIDWKDYHAPPVGAGFWLALHMEAKRLGYKKVLVYCYGGHGRTGTALAGILIECAHYDDKHAIDFVREKMCKKCVESKEQEDYLAEISAVVKATDLANEVKAKQTQ